MNTATRVLETTALIQRGQLISVSVRHFWLALLTVFLFVTAFGIIYAKDMNRRLYIEAQTLEHQNERVTERWSKLLLERSALSTQTRIERLAKVRLQMELPRSKGIQLVVSQTHHSQKS